jgi:hypothetical protein
VERLERYIEVLREQCAALPDRRSGGNARYTMTDIGLAAFSVFFMQSPSFLAHQRALAHGRGRSNAETLFGMTTIPSDNHIRQMLDGAPTNHFDTAFGNIVKELDKSGGLRPMRRLGGRTLIALDGSEHFCSRKINCPYCSTRKRADGEREYFHTFLAATLVAPGHATVLPLAPEFVRREDGAEKQDCETAAARRWLTRLAPAYAWLEPVYVGDDLYARQPMCKDVLAAGRETVGKGSAKRIRRYRWMNGVPIKDGDDALLVNWLEIVIAKPNGEVTYRNSFITDLPVSRKNAADIVAAGRARWKVENETFNVLKNNGYNLEHNFGHGKQTLASVLVVLNLLAFAIHNACTLMEPAWQAAWRHLGARTRLFEHIRTITAYLVFPSWDSLFRSIRTGLPPPHTA